MSNFYPCEISAFGETLNSPEHCYQWRLAIEADQQELAINIKEAGHAGEAKALSKKIPANQKLNWNNMCVDVMKSIIQMKLDQVSQFKDALFESGDSILAEGTSDLFWASGLSPEQTKVSH
jgi:ribA/ribD-fused uncharacterized protein